MANTSNPANWNEEQSKPNGQPGPTRDIIVIGGSAGSIDVVCEIVGKLPEGLAAAVFVVVHSSPSSPEYLAKIFANCGKIPVRYAEDREPIELGNVYIAPPDRHLLIKRGEMRVILGPKENNFRPAIDPLFRSAATTYDGRVIGVVVTGSLDDGSHGLLQIKRCGGIAIVQSPEEAAYASMPRSAIERVEVDHIVPASEIGPLLEQLLTRASDKTSPLGEDEVDVAEGLLSALRIKDLPSPGPFSCPDCKGALWECNDGSAVKYRCHVGHGYTADTLLALQSIEIEQALWSAVRGFEEKALLQRRTAEGRAGLNPQMRTRLLENAKEQQQMADVVRALLVSPEHGDREPVGKSIAREYGK